MAGASLNNGTPRSSKSRREFSRAGPPLVWIKVVLRLTPQCAVHPRPASPGSWSSFEAFASASLAPSGGILISTAFEMLLPPRRATRARSRRRRAVAICGCGPLAAASTAPATWSHDAIEGRDAAKRTAQTATDPRVAVAVLRPRIDPDDKHPSMADRACAFEA